MNEYKVGDIVMLRSGGPRMTVMSFRPKEESYLPGHVNVAWFGGETVLKHLTVDPEAIMPFPSIPEKNPCHGCREECHDCPGDGPESSDPVVIGDGEDSNLCGDCFNGGCCDGSKHRD